MYVDSHKCHPTLEQCAHAMHQCTSRCPAHALRGVCIRGELTHDASFSLYKDILLLAGREAGPERWLLFTEPAPTLKEAQLDFLRFLLHAWEGRWAEEGFNMEI